MFATIVKGPDSTTGKNYSPQSLLLDRQNNLVASVGDAGVEAYFQSALSVQGAQTPLTTITTAQNLYSKTLNARVLNMVGRTLRISGQFVYTSPGTTAPKLTIAVSLGATAIVSIQTAGLSTTASTNMPVQFEFLITVISSGSAGTIEGHGEVTANISANTPAAAANTYIDTNTAVSSAVDLTSALALTVTIAADSTVTGATSRQVVVEVVA